MAKQDQPIVLDLALAWRLSGDRRYFDQAVRYLIARADVYRMSFNPIDETGFDALLLATDLVEADLPPSTRATLDRFWRRMAEGYLSAMDGTPKNRHTNWQSHRVKLATLAAFQVGDPALIARAREAFRRQIAANVRPDGSVFDFHERDALHYVTYDLDPLLVAAIAAQRPMPVARRPILNSSVRGSSSIAIARRRGRANMRRIRGSAGMQSTPSPWPRSSTAPTCASPRLWAGRPSGCRRHGSPCCSKARQLVEL
jgi:hypothetical protein